jgi:hypothetical protein
MGHIVEEFVPIVGAGAKPMKSRKNRKEIGKK